MAARLYGILGNAMMSFMSYEGKCGLLALSMRGAEAQRQLKDGPRALAVEPRQHDGAPGWWRASRGASARAWGCGNNASWH